MTGQQSSRESHGFDRWERVGLRWVRYPLGSGNPEDFYGAPTGLHEKRPLRTRDRIARDRGDTSAFARSSPALWRGLPIGSPRPVGDQKRAQSKSSPVQPRRPAGRRAVETPSPLVLRLSIALAKTRNPRGKGPSSTRERAPGIEQVERNAAGKGVRGTYGMQTE
jgi:hypothetical protein